MKVARNGAVFLLAGAMLMAAADAAAQFRGGGFGGMRGGQHQGAKQESGEPGQPARVDQLEEIIEELREDLKLAPGQQHAWDVYVERVRSLASDIGRERSQAKTTMQLGLLRRLDHSVDVARDRLTAIEDIADAAKALYAGLTPEQKSVADPRLATIIPAPDGEAPGAASRSRNGKQKGPAD